eukprot:CAMPEP_0194347334 /NCGR_PEP_ID=MMETSP0171-20130528/105934_1 /TAXON_ID=218684 /ORGANISM="Corethron pennatum, Strain L29A3" /LENGTH=138 /DNA_ID=CAMNT_0039114577 /DNA_START=738 /DNA_END=1154 /DNA_ORIENTATION=-
MEPTRIIKPRQGLDLQTVEGGMFRQQRCQGLLVAPVHQYIVAMVQNARQQVSRPFVVSDVVEAAVGGERRKPLAPRSVVLKQNVVLLQRAGRITESGEGVTVPHHIHVLEEHVVSHKVYQLDCYNFCVHHRCEDPIAV